MTQSLQSWRPIGCNSDRTQTMEPGTHWLKVLTLTKNAVTQSFSLVKNFFWQKMSKGSPPIGQKTTQWRHGVYKGPLFRDSITLQTSYSS